MNKLELTSQCDMYQTTGCQEGWQAEPKGICDRAPTSVHSIKILQQDLECIWWKSS
jgi:hypothetical protein